MLGYPDQLVEIEAVAVRRERQARVRRTDPRRVGSVARRHHFRNLAVSWMI
jgi:hypothetical protein